MDPISGIASIAALVALSKDIVQSCRKYIKDYKDAPIVLSRFCRELEALTILFNYFAILQTTAQNVPSSHSGALTEILRHVDFLKDSECQLRELDAKIKRVDLRHIGRRLLFPLQEHQILDGLNVVHRIQSMLQSALLLDDSFCTQSIRNEVQKLSATLKTNHNQISIENSRSQAQLRETIAVLRDGIFRPRSTVTTDIAGVSQVRDPEYVCRQSRQASYRTQTKRTFNLSFGRVSIRNENSAESLGLRQTSWKAKRSRVVIAFAPSPNFWQTMIHLQLEWAAHLDSLMVPTLSLQFLDVVQDDHPIIRASIRGDLYMLRDTFSSQRVSSLCSTKDGWTPLHFAAAYGQTDACKLLIAEGAPLGATGFRGITPLHLAAHFGRLDAFKALLNAGSDPDEYHENGTNAVFEILSNETISTSPDLSNFLKWLFQGQDKFVLDIQATDNSKRGVLYHLAYPPGWTSHPTLPLTTVQSEIIELALHEGFRSDVLDFYELSILHEACRDGRLDLVKILLAGDCRINATNAKGYTPLHYAVESRNFELVSLLLRHGSDIHAATHEDDFRSWRWDFTPLCFAATLNWVEIVDHLILHGAGYSQKEVSDAFCAAVNTQSLETVQYFIKNKVKQLNFSSTILEAAGNSDMIERLFNLGASLEDKDVSGRRPLTRAAIYGWNDAVKKLVELGADLDNISWHLTPLGHAAEKGYSEIVDILLTAGAQSDLTGDQMPTPWQLATSHGYTEIAENIARFVHASSTSKLTDSLKMETTENQVEVVETPLELKWDLTAAIKRGNLEVVENLIEAGCSLEAEKDDIWSPLHYAIVKDHWEIAGKLIEAGAELDVCGVDDFDMPFMRAVTFENTDLIQLMIRHGANTNIRNGTGSTPLLENLDLYETYDSPVGKSRCRNGEIVRVLLGAGANVNAVDNFGRTSLGKAAAIGNLEAVVALVKAGADLNRPSSQNSEKDISWVPKLFYRTPLAWAALEGHENVVSFLLSSGAEWRSLQKEPALTSTHRLLMKSWFPDDVERPVDDVPCVELLSVLSGDAISESGSIKTSH